MPLIIQSQLNDEFLSSKEIEELTGTSRVLIQSQWLKEQLWEFSINKKNKIKIGRWYFRLKMAGVSMQNNISFEGQHATDTPNFSGLS